jgi:hypothetical protein
MRREELIRLLRQQPFQPIRLRLSNGIVHEIRHPDMAIVLPSAVHVGVSRTGASADLADDFVIVSLIHIVQIEVLAPHSPAATN